MARYRDTKTGRLVSKETWKRSRARGGKRYKREYTKPKPKNTYYLCSVKYDSDSGSFRVDFIVNAHIPKGYSEEKIETLISERIDAYCKLHNMDWVEEHGEETTFSKGDENEKPESVEVREVQRFGKRRRK